MTNTMNTPAEAIEMTYPFSIAEYSLRPSSGGHGRYRGGHGIRRAYHFLAPATVTIISERRRLHPWGLAGGQPAATGRNTLHRAGGDTIDLPAKCQLSVQPGDILSIDTPGGGGWGSP